MFIWLNILIMLNSYGAVMRLDENEESFKKPFSCIPKLPNFDSEMTVGGNFSGHIQKLCINFMRREMKPSSRPVTSEKYIYPCSVSNVIYENSETNEGKSLDDLILIPCGSVMLFSIELVVKTASQDGALMLIRHSDATKYLVLSFEPRRVLLRLIIDDCIYQCFQPIDFHVGQWTYIAVDFDKEKTWGLAVNGGIRKVIKNRRVSLFISCLDHIMVGDVVEVIHKLEEKNKLLINNTHVRQISGVLGYIRVNKKIIDVHTLPVLVERGNTHFSSETISQSKQYEEVEIIYGQQVNLTCFYGAYNDKGKKIYSSFYTDETQPLWIKFDRPLMPNDTELMNDIGIIYNIFDNGEVTMLKIVKYTSRETVEGFYSCRISNAINDSIILTYGVTVIDERDEFSNFSTLILKTVSYLLLIVYGSVIIWLSVECKRSYTRNGIFSSICVIKQLRSTRLCEISHEESLRFILNIKSQMKKRRILGIRLRRNKK